MVNFHKYIGLRIAVISFLVSLLAAIIAYHIVQNNMVTTTMNFAVEDSHRILESKKADIHLSPGTLSQYAQLISDSMVGGLFEHAEVYDAHEVLLAESSDRSINKDLLEIYQRKHKLPDSKSPNAKMLELKSGEWVISIFIPLRNHIEGKEVLVGYIELIRHVPKWRKNNLDVTVYKLTAATFVLSLLFALLLYPVILMLFRSYQRKLDEVNNSHILLMEALGRAIAMRDSDTGIHNFRVTYISTKIGELMELKQEQLQKIVLGSFLHDIGKISISDNILMKNGPLTDEERKVMQGHVSLGIKIVGNMGWLQGATAIIGNHHEKWDGTGYPKGLTGEQIPIEARVFAVADVFDALCSKRPYKEPMSYVDALDIISKGSGKHFDPTVVSLFLKNSSQLYDFINTVTEDDGKVILDGFVKKYFKENTVTPFQFNLKAQ